ncbi:hypothetical protein L198_02677 [Cryptococcus wingfieldii CBS 7118]|uniref:BRCT domain-containing protein n=1 Tax=Cryptococcus wingfieldii CBS 7118 TaxID=1295528 RepID=A0A1E3JMR2_9TREE|nr:hypothetical protein L198_02677 [Cryptococcus wingfieldii CBS 7118]ODO01946.1 hypothetical protein L198_02677 [Cryptococcus wingfieldii CBS 7118]
MSPPRRRIQSSTTLQSISIRSHAPPLTPRQLDANTHVPITRSRSRFISAAPSRNENIKPAAASVPGFSKSLRSRGPIKDKENNSRENLKMGVYEDKKMAGKRKAGEVDEGDRKGKVMKLGEQPIRRMGPPLKAVPSNGNIEVRQTLLAPLSSPRRPQPKVQVSAPPTPAREILRQGLLKSKASQESLAEEDKSASLVIVRPPTPPRKHQPLQSESRSGDEDSSMEEVSSFVARPPTPPRMRERPTSVLLSPCPDGQALYASPNRMNGSTTPLTSPGQLTSHTPLRSPRGPQALISKPMSPRPFSAFHAPATPPKASPHMAVSTTPATRPNVKSPLTARRIAAAARMAKETASLDVEMAKPSKKAETVLANTLVPTSSELAEEPVTLEEQKPTVVTEETTPIDMPQELALHVESKRLSELPPARSTSGPSQLSKSVSSRSLQGAGAPSRIPIGRAMPPIRETLAPSAGAKKPATNLGIVGPERSALASGASAMSPLTEVKRKPSYPSSLGSGPLACPTARVVSNPMLPPRDIPQSSQSSLRSITSPSSRSVSNPGPRPRLSLSSSRREGLSDETSKSLAGLSSALEKLKAKKQLSNSSLSESTSEPARRTAPSVTVSAPTRPHIFQDRPSNLSASTSTSATSAVAKPRTSVLPSDICVSAGAGDTSLGDQSIAGMLAEGGARCFKGVVAFVDVRTSDGSDSTQVFANILRGAGAKVLTRPGSTCTHIIYRSGREATLNWYRRQDEEDRPKLVGIKWVMDSKKAGKRVEEDKYLVDLSDETVFDKRRKSMEPKSLAESKGLLSTATKKRTLLSAAAADAKQRSKASYAPKRSSPLKKAFLSLPSSSNADTK